MAHDKDRMYLTVQKGEMEGLEVGKEVNVYFKATVKGLSEDTRTPWDEENDKPGDEVTVHEIRLEYSQKDVNVIAPGEKNPFAEMAEEDA